jgi:hypothetical protein
MLPSHGQPNPMGSGQPSLLRTSSSLLTGAGGMGGGVLPSPSSRTQYGGNGLLAGPSNVASLLGRQSFGNGGPGAMPGGGIPMGALQQRGAGMDGVGDLVGSAGPDATSFPTSSQGSMGNQLGSDTLQQQQLMDAQQYSQQQQQHQQRQMSMPYNQHHMLPQTSQQPQQPQQSAGMNLENGGGFSGVKMDQQMGHPDQNGPAQMLPSSSGAKLEPQSQALRSFGAVKMDRQSSDPSVFLQQQQQQRQQQQQHMLQLSKQNPQVAATQMSLLQQQQQQQRYRHLQQQQQQHQQQILKNLPLQRNQMQQQQQQQQLLRQQSLNMRTPGKPTPYEPGTCAKRLTHYIYHEQNRPQVSL